MPSAAPGRDRAGRSVERARNARRRSLTPSKASGPQPQGGGRRKPAQGAGWTRARKHVESGKVVTPGARFIGLLAKLRVLKQAYWKLLSARIVRNDAESLGLQLDEYNIVTSIDEDSPASRSGKLLEGDVIVSVDGVELGRSTLGAVLIPLRVHFLTAYRWMGEPSAEMIGSAPDAVRRAMEGGHRRSARVLVASARRAASLGETPRPDDERFSLLKSLGRPGGASAAKSDGPGGASAGAAGADGAGSASADGEVARAAPAPLVAQLALVERKSAASSCESDEDDRSGSAAAERGGRESGAGFRDEDAGSGGESEYESYSSDDSRYWGVSERPKTPRGMRAKRAAEAEAAAAAAERAGAATTGSAGGVGGGSGGGGGKGGAGFSLRMPIAQPYAASAAAQPGALRSPDRAGADGGREAAAAAAGFAGHRPTPPHRKPPPPLAAVGAEGSGGGWHGPEASARDVERDEYGRPRAVSDVPPLPPFPRVHPHQHSHRHHHEHSRPHRSSVNGISLTTAAGLKPPASFVPPLFPPPPGSVRALSAENSGSSAPASRRASHRRAVADGGALAAGRRLERSSTSFSSNSGSYTGSYSNGYGGGYGGGYADEHGSARGGYGGYGGYGGEPNGCSGRGHAGAAGWTPSPSARLRGLGQPPQQPATLPPRSRRLYPRGTPQSAPPAPRVPILNLNDIAKRVDETMGGGEFVTPRGHTRLRRHTVFTHKTYFEQFGKKFEGMLARGGLSGWLHGSGDGSGAHNGPPGRGNAGGQGNGEWAGYSSSSVSGGGEASERGNLFAPRGQPRAQPYGLPPSQPPPPPQPHVAPLSHSDVDMLIFGGARITEAEDGHEADEEWLDA